MVELPKLHDCPFIEPAETTENGPNTTPEGGVAPPAKLITTKSPTCAPETLKVSVPHAPAPSVNPIFPVTEAPANFARVTLPFASAAALIDPAVTELAEAAVKENSDTGAKRTGVLGAIGTPSIVT